MSNEVLDSTGVSFLEPIHILKDSIVPDSDTFNFLDMTGRKAFYSQGYKGKGVKCAILDTGVNYNHKEFKRSDGSSKIIHGKSFCDYTENYLDDNGHGTHTCASVIGNDAGVAPDVDGMVVIKVLGGDGGNNIDRIIDGFEYLANWKDSKGNYVDTASASLSIPERYMTPGQIDRFEAVINKIYNNGIQLFVSAGNTGVTTTERRFPADFQNVISIAAVDMQKQVAYFSTRSPNVDMCQVGTNIVSASNVGNEYEELSGTSMATPISHGTGILIICKHKFLEKKRMSCVEFWATARILTIDIDVIGVDQASGAGFFTLDQRVLKILLMQLGSLDYTVNGKPFKFRVAPFELDGITRVELRSYTGALDGTTQWIEATNQIMVTLQ